MMTQIFVDGLDYHQRTAEMVSLQAWGVHPSAVTSAHRKAAKIINFRTLYGGGDAANAKEIGCTTAEAARVREAIFGKFTKLASFIQACRNRALKTGFAWTWWNGEDFRRRSLYRVADPDDEMRTVHEHASWNTPIQGTASDFCLASLVEIVNWIKDDCVPARVVMTVHDSIVLEVDEGAVREVYEQVRRIMQSWPANGVPLVADMEIGRSWGSMEELSFCQHCDQRELVDHAPGIVDRFCCPARESVFRLTGS
jgi:DNA polymerase-1